MFSLKQTVRTAATWLVVLCLVLTVGLAVSRSEKAAQARAKLQIVTSINVLADLVKNVGRDRVIVTSITSGLETPHTYEPRASDMRAVARADAFVKVGLGLEVWADRLLRSAGNKDLLVIEASSGIEVLEAHEEDHGGGGSHSEHEHSGNPHIWLDPDNAIRIVNQIRDGLCRLDPASKAYFEKNARDYVAQIRALKTELGKEVTSLPDRRIVSHPASYPYFFRAFGFQEVARLEETHGQEPSPKRVAEVIRIMRQEKIKVIVTEKLFSDRLAKTVARETGARIVYLTPLLGGLPGVDSYLDMIRHNVTELVKALRG